MVRNRASAVTRAVMTFMMKVWRWLLTLGCCGIVSERAEYQISFETRDLREKEM